tara:strand:- start:892 stop:1284 length:393 start_codon:yes stop_codon:yes gene_type:complete
MKNSQIIKEMSKIYNEKVEYFLNESGVYDKHGNNIVDKAVGLKVFDKDTGYRYHVGGYHKEGNKEFLLLLNPDQPNPSAKITPSSRVLTDDYEESISDNKSISINDLEKDTYILVPIEEFDKKYTYKREK